MERRLAAILFADVVNYTRLVQLDEEGTHRRLKALQTELLVPAINAHHGRVVKTTGDGILAEFQSAIDAVRCAITLQSKSDERNIGQSEPPMDLRIGINVGDIIIDGDDVFGDGVNVASRLEGEADPGGICLSGTAYDQVKLEFADRCTFIGEVALKNIAEPVRVYKISDKPAPDKFRPTSTDQAGYAPSLGTKLAGAVVIILALAVIGLWVTGQLSDDKISSAGGLSGKVAVLPFKNLSNDPDQQFFADGLSEDLITDLSKIRGLSVISSTSSFAFRDAKVPMKEIAQRLKARYIIEGSVQRRTKTLRISAKLFDTSTESQLWANRFNGATDDVFSFQDKITSEVIQSLKVILTPEGERAIASRGTKNPDAYDAYLRGMRLISSRRSLDVEANKQAIAAFEEALQHDRQYPNALAGLGWAKWLNYSTINFHGFQMRDAAFKDAETSLSFGETALAHRVLARKYYSPTLHIVQPARDRQKAALQLQSALLVEPNNSDILADLSEVLPFIGESKRALAVIERAIDLNPDHPDWYYRPYGIALLLNGQYEKAARILETWLKKEAVLVDYQLWLSAALALAGKTDQARAILPVVFKIGSNNLPVTFYALKRTWPLNEKDEATFFKGLRLAGFPEAFQAK